MVETRFIGSAPHMSVVNDGTAQIGPTVAGAHEGWRKNHVVRTGCDTRNLPGIELVMTAVDCKVETFEKSVGQES